MTSNSPDGKADRTLVMVGVNGVEYVLSTDEAGVLDAMTRIETGEGWVNLTGRTDQPSAAPGARAVLARQIVSVQVRERR